MNAFGSARGFMDYQISIVSVRFLQTHQTCAQWSGIWSERSFNSVTALISWQVETHWKYCHISTMSMMFCSGQKFSIITSHLVWGISLLSSLSLLISHSMIRGILFPQRILPFLLSILYNPLTHIKCEFLAVSVVPRLLTHSEPQESSSNICLRSQWKQHLLRAWCHEGMWGIFQACCQSGGPCMRDSGQRVMILQRPLACWLCAERTNAWADGWPAVARAGKNSGLKCTVLKKVYKVCMLVSEASHLSCSLASCCVFEHLFFA